MSEILEYKCPACGGAMEFDSATQKMKCPYCDTVIEMEDFHADQDSEAAGRTEETERTKKRAGGEPEGKRTWQAEETDGMKVYICESCGGEIIAEETTGATTCPFCGNRIVLKGQFEGDLRPDYLIPFKLDKKEAKERYYNFLKGKKFLPAIFKKENHIDEMKGIYVPFWIFDMKVHADAVYRAERVRIWRNGNTEYTETEFFRVNRAGDMSFEKIPEDGSQKMDDSLMESIEPFEFSEAVEFRPAYLAGYIADRYDVKMEECRERAVNRIRQSAENSLRSTVNGYHTVTTESTNVRVTRSDSQYVLYPVWLLNTTWNNRKFTFAMNGQTGKFIGDLPCDRKAFWLYILRWGAIIGVILFVIGGFF